MSTYKTPKGTVLPILLLKGKEYLEVKYRLVWFREEHPDYGIETEFLLLSGEAAVAKATIRDASGRILSQGTKSETPKGFPDYIEKAESGSIGRALALIGYGTQFCADELDEGERIVDSPVPPRAKPMAMDKIPNFPAPVKKASGDSGAFVLAFGKHKGKTLEQIGAHDADSYGSWLVQNADEKRQPLSGPALEAVNAIKAFCKSREFSREGKGA